MPKKAVKKVEPKTVVIDTFLDDIAEEAIECLPPNPDCRNEDDSWATVDQGDGSLKVDPPPKYIEYHLRYTIKNKKDAIHIMEEYIKYWEPTKYIFCYELSEKKQPHVHATIQCTYEYSKQTMSKFMSKMPLFKENKEASAYHHERIRNRTKNDVYVIKDDCIIGTNYEKKEIDELKLLKEAMQNEMKMTPLQRLFEKLKMMLPPNHLYELAVRITNIYIDEYNQPPPMPQLKGWTIYLWAKLGYNRDDIENSIEKLF